MIKLEGDWLDISTEAWREYVFPTGSYHILKPSQLLVKRKSEGDSHRVIDTAGVSHYIPVGWLALRWTGHDGPEYSF